MILTYKYRVKDRSAAKDLRGHARAVNLVWNYCCEVQRKAESNWNAGMVSRWPNHFDLTKLCGGVGKELGIGAETIGEICRQFVSSRNQARRAPNFRASGGSRRSLGWIPLKGRFVTEKNGRVSWYGNVYRFWKSRELGGPIKTGQLVEDARGRWYVTFQCEVDDSLPTGVGTIGIDLGLKTLATCSNGDTVPALQHYRKYQGALSTARRAGNMRRVKAIHAKIANARRDQLQKASTKIARDNQLIVVGNVKSDPFMQTRMAKSISDAGWYAFRRMLEYKASRHQAIYIEADERWSSQTCSDCGTIGGPKGIAGLGIRRWICECGSSHDRDVNAARNILRAGQSTLPHADGSRVYRMGATLRGRIVTSTGAKP